ncbi:hypothetical protein Ahy_A09g046021 [Arachis hypogaea]|uniref:Ubiquitin-like protease family profile domain-containing protein n=1 Tax=Arachis hypogaea TaxID=3818 RepID=A0A445BNS4_ARAHY|nr:hypothetical protein Ahy_A09g046021 [Arachis hypogaea]
MAMLQIFAPVCYAKHWWLWVADVRKKICILDPYHKTYPSKPRMKLNKFVVSVFCDPLGVFSYDCAIYVMKWLEIIESQNIKNGRYNCENWTQVEVDHFRVEYVSRILFHEMNQDRDTAIKESEAIRLSKLSAVLLSPYCQIDSDEINSD